MLKKFLSEVNWHWTLFWSGILVSSFIGEMVAVLNSGAGDTFSEQFWAFIDIGQAFWVGALGAFCGGFAILVWHFFFGRAK